MAGYCWPQGLETRQSTPTHAINPHTKPITFRQERRAVLLLKDSTCKPLVYFTRDKARAAGCAFV
jgi:hypothetical protein